VCHVMFFVSCYVYCFLLCLLCPVVFIVSCCVYCVMLYLLCHVVFFFVSSYGIVEEYLHRSQ